ncbi:MAG: alpha/beta hydrolase [Kouleothrix sp.]|jgi:pimeloyl-ACP methyl ester carboxylesterase|nr:alpha/beta hydrolase [Kouleothrix sp.]
MFINIGGRRIAAEFAGIGTPTVVFDAFGGAGTDAWAPLWSAVTAFTHACRYDRAGTGQSDPFPEPVSGRQLVADLHTVLAQTQTAPPFLLVGASFGGAIMQLFARTHPALTAGLILLDSMHWDQVPRFYQSDPRHGAALEEEIATHLAAVDWPSTAQQLRNAPPLPTIPLRVISRGRQTVVGAVWADLQRDLVQQSARGQQIIAEQSGHGIVFDQPELVVEVIRALVFDLRDTSTTV